MSCRWTAVSLFLVLVLRVQSIDSTYARSFSSQLDFDLPELDGSPVDTCRIVTVPSPDTIITTTTTITTPTKPITRKQVVATKKPAVQSPPRKPETKNPETPIRPQPAPTGPITDRHSYPINSLLDYLLANSRRHAAGSGVGRTEEKKWKIDSSSSEDSSDES